MSLPSINFLHLMVSEIQPGQTFSHRLPAAHPDTLGENNTPTALKGCGVKTMSQIWQVHTPLAEQKGSNHDAQLHPQTGFEINKNLPVHYQQKYLQVKKIKNYQVTLFCKLFTYTHLAQSNYGWVVLNIVQTYQSNLSHLYICFAWSNYGFNF